MTFHLAPRGYVRPMLKTVALVLCLSLPCLPSLAQSTDRVENLDAALLPGWQTETGSHMAALQLDLAPGWKTYWRIPGEAGLPPLFNWSGSENVKSVRIHWPSPEVFETNGLQSVGYHDSVTLPLEVTARDPSKPLRLSAQIDLGICRDICLPASLHLSTDLISPGGPDTAISAALALRPDTAKEAGLGAINCTVEPIADGLRITAVMLLPKQGTPETVVFEPSQPDIWVARATTRRDAGQLIAVTEMVAPTGAPFALERSKLTLTVLAKGKSVEIRGCPAP